ncbi:MAG TPA: YbaB/EbfC family nucleoid-associated protein [Nocardia sp.]|uniref:YbaB/EbfC family nucleoid-associated protein n=1 Tax=Nocardia TaxID=1817 RepID=UPI002456A416|nr:MULTISPECIES: YbaB/EbfC family nucleoid-associated protein [Nocardia]HLS76879.1 YbaB/EbfC family nucleoid-associated protein [Nocardia sp.]
MSAMDELEDRVRRQLDRIRDLGDRMTAVRAQASSPGGEVTVVVDGDGALRDLRFSEGIRRLGPAEFERMVVETAARAAAEAFTERADLVNAFNEEMSQR